MMPLHKKELLRLQEEEERLEQELIAAQRVSELMRARNDAKKRIAALQSRSSGSPAPKELGSTRARSPQTLMPDLSLCAFLLLGSSLV